MGTMGLEPAKNVGNYHLTSVLNIGMNKLLSVEPKVNASDTMLEIIMDKLRTKMFTGIQSE